MAMEKVTWGLTYFDQFSYQPKSHRQTAKTQAILISISLVL